MSDKIEKLSDAIRIGAKSGGQLYYKLLDNSHNSCAMGAAYIAVFPDITETDCIKIDTHKKIQNQLQTDELVMHPIRKWKCHLTIIVVDLNNTYRWTREQIADWLESIGH